MRNNNMLSTEHQELLGKRRTTWFLPLSPVVHDVLVHAYLSRSEPKKKKDFHKFQSVSE